MTTEFLQEQIQKAEGIVVSKENPYWKLSELRAIGDQIGEFAVKDKLRAPEETDTLQVKLDSLMDELRKNLPV